MIGRRPLRLVMSDDDSRRVIEQFGPLLASSAARRRRRVRAWLALTALLLGAVGWLVGAWP